MKKFWKWMNQAQTETTPAQRTLYLNGTIAEESWFDDDVTPQLFKEELNSGSGDITVWINSPGGDCVAAAQIYNMLIDYKGNVTVKIDGIAASAASVIAMAGTKVLMSPVSMMMIHNPMTIAMGDKAEMEKAIEMLSEVKESIMNAYEIKTGLSRAKISHLMDAETWMNANKAMLSLFRRTDLRQDFKEVLTDLLSVIAVGLADEPDGIRQQDVALRFLRFVFLPLFIFFVRDLLHGGYLVKLEVI